MATQEIKYTRTIVPSSMRSPYWKYFGFPSDNDNNILTRQKIICILCNAAIAYNKNTSNLRTHLIARHPELLHILQMQQQSQQFQEESSTGKAEIDAGSGLDGGRSSTMHRKRRQDSDNITSMPTKLRRQKLKIETYSIDSVLNDDYDVVGGGNDECAVSSADAEAYIDAEFKSVIEANELNAQHDNCTNADDHPDNDDGEADETNAHDEVVELIDSDNSGANNQDAIEITYNFATAATDVAATVSMTNDVVAQTYDFADLMPSLEKTKITPNNCEQLMNMLISDLLPINTVCGEGFQQLFGHANKIELESKIRSKHADMHRHICSHLHSISQKIPYSLCIELSENIEKYEVLNIYFNCINIECNEMLNILYYDAQWKDLDFNKILKNLNLEKCAAIVTNMHNSQLTEFANSHGISIIKCLDSVVTSCLMQIFDSANVSAAFQKIYRLSNDIDQNSMLIAMPDVHENCPWSKFIFLQFILENAVLNDLLEAEFMNELQHFVEYLHPLKITLETIAEEVFPICTLIRPLTMKLFDQHFSIVGTHNRYVNEARKIIEIELTSNILKNAFLNQATFFDARFQHDFIEKQPEQQHGRHNQIQQQHQCYDRTTVKQSICKRFKQLIELTNPPKPAIKSEQKANAINGKRKSTLKSFFNRINDASISSSSNAHMLPAPPPPPQKSNIELEFDKYKCEPILDLEQCPISWWQEHAYKYKQLRKIADTYTCVPCCVNRLFRTYCSDANERVTWLNKRFVLRQQSASAEKCLWYLHYNKSIYDKISSI